MWFVGPAWRGHFSHAHKVHVHIHGANRKPPCVLVGGQPCVYLISMPVARSGVIWYSRPRAIQQPGPTVDHHLDSWAGATARANRETKDGWSIHNCCSLPLRTSCWLENTSRPCCWNHCSFAACCYLSAECTSNTSLHKNQYHMISTSCLADFTTLLTSCWRAMASKDQLLYFSLETTEKKQRWWGRHNDCIIYSPWQSAHWLIK